MMPKLAVYSFVRQLNPNEDSWPANWTFYKNVEGKAYICSCCDDLNVTLPLGAPITEVAKSLGKYTLRAFLFRDEVYETKSLVLELPNDCIPCKKLFILPQGYLYQLVF